LYAEPLAKDGFESGRLQRFRAHLTGPRELVHNSE
jgi:hypothetical protein